MLSNYAPEALHRTNKDASYNNAVSSHVTAYIQSGYGQAHLNDPDPTMENSNLVSDQNVLQHAIKTTKKISG